MADNYKILGQGIAYSEGSAATSWVRSDISPSIYAYSVQNVNHRKSNIALDSAGNYYRLYYSNQDSIADIAKINKYGKIVWRSSLPINQNIVHVEMHVQESGSLYIALRYILEANNSGQIVLFKMNQSGDIEWQTEYGLLENREGEFSLKVDSEGSVLLAANTNPTTAFADADMSIAKWSSDGVLQFNKILVSPNSQSSPTLAVDSNLDIYLGFASYDPKYSFYYEFHRVIIKIDKTSGNIVWSTKLDWSASASTPLMFDSQNNLYYLSQRRSDGYILAKFNSVNGSMLWSKFVISSGENADERIGLELDEASGVVKVIARSRGYSSVVRGTPLAIVNHSISDGSIINSKIMGLGVRQGVINLINTTRYKYFVDGDSIYQVDEFDQVKALTFNVSHSDPQLSSYAQTDLTFDADDDYVYFTILIRNFTDIYSTNPTNPYHVHFKISHDNFTGGQYDLGDLQLTTEVVEPVYVIEDTISVHPTIPQQTNTESITALDIVEDLAIPSSYTTQEPASYLGSKEFSLSSVFYVQDSIIYSVPLETYTSVSSISIINSSDEPVDYKLGVVSSKHLSSAESPIDTLPASPTKLEFGDLHTVIPDRSIEPNTVDEIVGGMTLSAGDQIRITPVSSDLIVHIYGVEIS